MKEIYKYLYDSKKLIKIIGFLLGSDEWQIEHKQPLRRQKGKIFYLLFNNGEFVGMCSIYKNQIMDVHIISEYRNNGYGDYLIKNIGGKYAGSSNPAMIKILEKNGLAYYLSRGKYRYYKRSI